ncbi:hypothetical protein VDGL01_04730 [Verticillium dahliae]
MDLSECTKARGPGNRSRVLRDVWMLVEEDCAASVSRKKIGRGAFGSWRVWTRAAPGPEWE